LNFLSFGKLSELDFFLGTDCAVRLVVIIHQSIPDVGALTWMISNYPPAAKWGCAGSTM
jgi:hypothetical protein